MYKSPPATMFNTTSLFAAMEKKKLLDKARLELRLFQALHEKAKHMNVVEELEKCMAEGLAPSIPFLTYKYGSVYNDYDQLDREQLFSEELREKARADTLRTPPGPRMKHLAYAMSTTLEELVHEALPPHEGKMLLKRCDGARTIPAHHLFNKRFGALGLFRHFLGEGLDVKIEYMNIEFASDRKYEANNIVSSTIRWNIVFTGKKKMPWTISQHIPADTLIWCTLNELLTTPFSPHWTRLSFPYWKNSHMSDEIVAWCEAGNTITEEMSWDMSDAGDLEARRDPGPSEHDLGLCQVFGCDGKVGDGGFCRKCSCKVIEADSSCPHGGLHMAVHMARVTEAGEPVVHGLVKCKPCGYRKQWIIR